VDRRRGEFEEFANASVGRLVRTAYALTGDFSTAEDLVQEVLAQVFIAWPRVTDPFSYARRALVNRSNNRWRDRSRRPETALTAEHDREDRDRITNSDDRDALIRAILALPSRQRAVVVLRFLEELTPAETADALSCSIGTVKSQTSKALARLRVLLPPDGKVPAARSPLRRTS
jgi:RNA polymerase sigma-70 factor (sigma-E family)